MSVVKFSKQNIAPNPLEIDYWVDVNTNPYGGVIKYYNGVTWAVLTSQDGTPVNMDDFYTKLQVNQMLATKASIESVESKIDDAELSNLLNNIEFKDKSGNGVDMLIFKYDGTNVGITLPVAGNTSAGILTKEQFKNTVKQNQLQSLYSEMYDKITEIYTKFQKKLKAGNNIKIDESTNTISATGKISLDWDDLYNKPDLYDKEQIDNIISTVYKIKGSVMFEDLPTEGNEIGDTYNIKNTFVLNGEEYPLGTNVVWTEEGWDALAGIFDTSELEESIETVDNKFDDYLPLTGGEITTNLRITSGYDKKLICKSIDGEYHNEISFCEGDEEYGSIVFGNTYTRVKGAGDFTYNMYKIWHEGNDGADSGLDADTLDGKHLTDILASDITGNAATATKADSASNSSNLTGYHGTRFLRNEVGQTTDKGTYLSLLSLFTCFATGSYAPVPGHDYGTCINVRANNATALHFYVPDNTFNPGQIYYKGTWNGLTVDNFDSKPWYHIVTNRHGEVCDWYGVSWSENDSDPTCRRIGNMAYHRSLPIQSAMKGYFITNNSAAVSEVILPIDETWDNVLYNSTSNYSLPLSNVNTYGNTMVKIPEFWYIDEYETDTKTHNLKISQTAKAGWCHHKEAYVGAYEGNNTGTHYVSQSGYAPTTNVTREVLRPLARANGYEGEAKWNIYTYEEHRAICHLFLVEYATRNSQLAVNTALTSAGFKQGGLGSGCTTGTVTIDGATKYSFVPAGTTDSLGNGSGQVAYTVIQTDADGNETTTVTRYANRYRGIENPFGHVWKHCDDVITQYDADTTYRTVYKCEKPDQFATNKNTKYKPLCSFPGGGEGYLKEIKATINCDFFPMVKAGATSTTYWCDYSYCNTDTAEHCVLIGGDSGDGGTAGLFRLALSAGVSSSISHIGSRLTYLPWAE